MKKNDIILMGAILLAALLLFVGYNFLFKQSGDSVTISIDNQVYATLPLNQDSTLTIPGENGGENILEIKNGAASITYADCPDKLCVHQKEIKNQGETLVCLPHKVIVSVTSSEERELDGIAQ